MLWNSVCLSSFQNPSLSFECLFQHSLRDGDCAKVVLFFCSLRTFLVLDQLGWKRKQPQALCSRLP